MPKYRLPALGVQLTSAVAAHVDLGPSRPEIPVQIKSSILRFFGLSAHMLRAVLSIGGRLSETGK